MAQCSAKAKSTGERCRRRAVNGYSVCQVHGAGSPKKGRPGGRPIRTGRYSKFLPERLAARYEEAASDPELLALRDEISLMDTRISELITKIDTVESGATWKALAKAYDDMMHAKNDSEASAAMALIGDLIEAGAHEYATWREIGFALDQRRKLVETERKRLVDMQQMITAERAMLLIAQVVDIIREHVEDRHVRAAISAELRDLSTKPGGG